MPFWNPPLWSRKGVLHWSGFAAITLGAVAGGVTAGLTDPKERTVSASVGGVFAVLAGLAGVRIKLLDDAEKAAKDQRAVEAEAKREAEHDALITRYGNQTRRMIRAVLIHMHGHFFEEEDAADQHKHRVTLFVYRAGTGPDGCTKWLAVHARKGAYEDSPTVWPLDDNEIDRCRGMAGRVWFLGSKDELAVDTAWDDNDPSKQAAYAQAMRLTVPEAAALKVKSQYFFGTVVMVHGRKWGVLLIDSRKKFRKPAAGGHEGRQNRRLDRYAELLGGMLAEAKE